MITCDSMLMRAGDRGGDLIAAPVGAELVMMSISSGSYYSFDELGTWMWARLDKPTSAAALCAELELEYDVSPDRCQADVLAFLQRLYTEGMIQMAA